MRPPAGVNLTALSTTLSSGSPASKRRRFSRKSAQPRSSVSSALAVPVIAVLDGIAFGGGLELALCCDLRVASFTAQMGLTETKLAIIPGAGGTQRLRVIVGEARAKEMIFTGKRLSADEALAHGIVSRVVPEAELPARLDAITDAPAALARDYAAATGLVDGTRVHVDAGDAPLTGTLRSFDVTAGVRYFGESQYVTPDDAAAGNQNNNASWRALTVSGSGDQLTVNGANVVCGGIKTTNATVYLIDSVLLPPAN